MEILTVSNIGIEAAVTRAAEILARGGLIVYPTDTLYGIGVNALDAAAVTRLRQVKAREAKKPLSVLASSLEEIRKHAEVSDLARAIAERHLPGALTLVLPAKPHIPAYLTHLGGTSFRVPRDEFSLELAHTAEHPVTATSANRAGMMTPSTIQDIIAHFGNDIQHIDLCIDDGPRDGGRASTVVSFVTDPPHIIREGAISREDLGL